MLRRRWSVLLTVCLAWQAQAQAPQGDPAAGKAAWAPCAACHGPAAEGNPALHAPALAGQHEDYLVRQLRNFRAGLRGAQPDDTYGVQMRGMALAMADDKAVADVSAWLASLPVPETTGEVPGDPRNGNNFYQGKCGACHGLTADGNPALNAPRLQGVDTGYLRRQFLAFREGRRGAHPEDRYGRQMALMSKTLDPGKELDDVLAYIHVQRGPGPKH